MSAITAAIAVLACQIRGDRALALARHHDFRRLRLGHCGRNGSGERSRERQRQHAVDHWDTSMECGVA
jgi:hypothetical protein